MKTVLETCQPAVERYFVLGGMSRALHIYAELEFTNLDRKV